MSHVPSSVRPAVVRDAESIARVHVQSWQAAYRGLVPDSFLDALRWEERLQRWEGLLADSSPARGSTLVAVTGQDNVVGFVSTGPARDEDIAGRGFVEVYAIYVSPGAWGRGEGTSLIRAAQAAVPRRAPGLVLWVLTGNERGRRFYERIGFRPDDATKVVDIGGRQLDELRYVLPSDPGGLQAPSDH